MLDEIQTQIPLPDTIVQHRQQVAVLQNAGITIPGRWTKTNAQLDDYLGMKSAAMRQLIEAVTHPDAKDDRTVLRGLAVAEAAASHTAVAQVNNAVIDAVLTKLVDTITAVAPDIYSRVSEMFNQTAASFTACASVCDPELDAETVVGKLVGKDEPAGVAWQNAEQHAARLTLLTPVLVTAAQLAGATIDPDNDTTVIALVCDPADRQRRRVWEAWVTEGGRCAKWAALLKCGCTLKAADLDNFQPYREPQPMETREEQIRDEEGRVVATRRVPHDPEDNPGALPPIDPRRPQKRTVVVGGL